MSLREIVVDAYPRSDVRRTLEYALATAVEFDSSLTVASFAWPRISIVGSALAASALAAKEQTRAMEEALRETRSAFDAVFAANPVDVEWCSGIVEPVTGLRDHLLTADLLITSASKTETCVSPDAAELALQSGTPVLRLGKGSMTHRFPRVILAWKDCSQARRAAHDALPFLKRAENVTVIGVGDEVSIERLEAVAKHLRRHEVVAEQLHIPRSRKNVGADLLNHAQRDGASLVVSGVYSHGPLTERLLGGVTTELIKDSDTSWLMAH